MFEKLLWKSYALLLAVGLSASGAAVAVETGRHQVVGGIDIYYGILPAQVAGKHPATHEERTMHGGVRVGKDQYHLIVSLYHADGQRITDAQVSATVGELGMAGARKKLEPMRIEDTMSFGNYFVLRGADLYRIAIEVKLPGAVKPVEALFDYRLR